MKKNQRGFGVIELLLALVTLALVISAGWYTWSRHNTANNKNSTNQSTKTHSSSPDKTFAVTITPSIGGGFMGATNTYEIDASGNVYHTHSPDYRTPTKKDLLKKIDVGEMQSLRQSFIDSGAYDSATGTGPQYSGSEWKVTINSQQKTFYDVSTPKFADPKAKLKQILGSDVIY